MPAPRLREDKFRGHDSLKFGNQHSSWWCYPPICDELRNQKLRPLVEEIHFFVAPRLFKASFSLSKIVANFVIPTMPNIFLKCFERPAIPTF